MEVDDGLPGLRVVEQAPGLPLDAFRGLEFAGAGRPEQLFVRHGVPEEVGEPRGELPGVQLIGVVRAGRQLEVEGGCLQDARDGEGHRLVDRFSGELRLPERFDPGSLSVAQRPAVRPLGEAEDARCGAGLAFRRRKIGPTRAAEERRREQGVGAEVHPGEVEFLDLVGGRTLALCDALEAVRAGLGRERPWPRVGRRWRREHALARGAPRADPVGDGRPFGPTISVPGEAEQVGDRVVVLGRRERQGRRLVRSGRFRRRSPSGLREGGGAEEQQDRSGIELHGGWRGPGTPVRDELVTLYH